MNDPLGNIDLVPWGRIRHCYGPATDVPALLRALQSSDAKEREQAWWELYGNLWHQQTIYEATPYAVPFLIHLLSDKGTPERTKVAFYLATLYFAETGEPNHLQSTRKAVADGVRVYLDLLKQGEVGEKIFAAYLLGATGRWGILSDDDDLSVIEQIGKAAEQ